MVLIRKPHTPDRPRELVGRRLFGNPDELFLQSKPKRGLRTPGQLRAMALAQLDLGPASVVWDIGAGSGSVAVEAAQIAAAGQVYAIEMDPEEHQLIVENARRFNVKNLKPILGRAPEAWDKLPDPDAIFIGNSGLRISRRFDAAYQRAAPRPAGGDHGQHRQRGRGPSASAGRFDRREGLDAEPRPGQLPVLPRAVRIDPSDVPGGDCQASVSPHATGEGRGEGS